MKLGDPALVTTPESTFIALYETHYDEVHAFCARRIGWQDARDATAEVFSVVWRRLDDAPIAQPRAWIFGVARHVIRNQWRTTARRRRLGERVRGLAGEHSESPERIVIARSTDSEVLSALGKLREDDQEILRLAAWDDLSGPEIAEVLGISLSAVQQRISRAKRRLANHMDTEGSDG